MTQDSNASTILREKNYRFRSLEASHLQLEETLEGFARRELLSPKEEIQKKTVQKEKLAAKDMMEEMLRRYQDTGEVNFK
ncbi:hypothetical protein MNBD_NITROSPIRAE01-122 [hydrothermal vent metagenome]|uniref:Uncharacterized protein n=1 Tax=hydrothermal vent metagenome TaxID=652676 RepID=A0A3B1CE65_9ZZZZ